MSTLWKDHPCFTPEARHTSARVHLPVAPRCNVQCRFCDRKFDCLNESRPGVTSRVLSPEEALDYLARVRTRLPQLAVVGIAGPGDPFANAGETLETLRGVRSRYPDLRLCVATNGLALPGYVAELAELAVSHVTVTVNAVDPTIGSQIYAWVRDGKRSIQSEEGAGLLLERQLDAIALLKGRGITVKINTLILPGINDAHIPEVAKRMKFMGVDLMNCMPLQLNAQTQARGWREPTEEEIKIAKDAAGALLPQMNHCTRCRSDAAGFLGEDQGPELLEKWAAGSAEACAGTEAAGCCSSKPAGGNQDATCLLSLDTSRDCIAVASRDGFLVSAHLGEARTLRIYKWGPSGPEFIEERLTPPAGGGTARWAALAETLKDCRALVVNGVGGSPRKTLEENRIPVFVLEGLISEALSDLFSNRTPGHMEKRRPFKCGESCAGAGNGCGA
jgi:nitrogen fixation protein NifB